jgi:4-hydroxy-4-methyl-2-oxoglutarate aldolase
MIALDVSLKEELGALGSATVYEAAGREGALWRSFTPIDPAVALVGPAFLVACPPGDNLAIHRAIALALPGDVLVIDAGGYTGAGHWGEITTVAAQARGIAGVVIDGTVRDSRPILARGFPVFHRGLCIAAATKKAPPAEPPTVLQFAGCTIRKGDMVVADADGIAIVPAERVAEVVEAARRRAADEQHTMTCLQDGQTTLELFGWQ